MYYPQEHVRVEAQLRLQYVFMFVLLFWSTWGPEFGSATVNMTNTTNTTNTTNMTNMTNMTNSPSNASVTHSSNSSSSDSGPNSNSNSYSYSYSNPFATLPTDGVLRYRAPSDKAGCNVSKVFHCFISHLSPLTSRASSVDLSSITQSFLSLLFFFDSTSFISSL